MSVFPGFGVNFKAAQANWVANKAFFKSIKDPNAQFGIRPNLQSAPVPWVVGDPSVVNSNAYWRACAENFAADPDFFVTWGMSGIGGTTILTPNNWQGLHDSVVSEATYLQSQGIVFGDFEVGNELENNRNNTILLLTQVGGTATAITARPHNYLTGDSINIGSASVSAYNGIFTVTVVNATTFTYSVPGGTASPAINALTWAYTPAQLNNLIRQLALDVKAVYPLSPISYGFGADTGSTADWVANGLGGLDTISIHPYGVVNIAAQTVSFTGANAVISAFAGAFGTKAYISEFNVSSTDASVQALNPVATVNAMNTMLAIIKNSGLDSKAMVYAWVGTLNANNDFAQLYTNGSMNPMWFDFFASNPTEYARGNRTTVSRTTVARTTVSRSTYPNRPLFNNS